MINEDVYLFFIETKLLSNQITLYAVFSFILHTLARSVIHTVLNINNKDIMNREIEFLSFFCMSECALISLYFESILNKNKQNPNKKS